MSGQQNEIGVGLIGFGTIGTGVVKVTPNSPYVGPCDPNHGTPATTQKIFGLAGEPADKAGGYAVQGLAAAFIQRIEGSYSGIMGLPLFETMQLLGTIGVHGRQQV